MSTNDTCYSVTTHLAKKDAATDKAAPAWLLEDFKKDGRGRPKRKPLSERKAAAEPSLRAPKQSKEAPQVQIDKPSRFKAAQDASLQPDQLITNAPTSMDIKAPSITVDADRGRVRKAWGAYRSASAATAMCAFARTGLPEETIQAMLGITNSQFHNWLSSDPELAKDYLTCRATWENAALSRIQEIADAKMDWKAYAYLLEKINPTRWGANAAPASTVDVPSEGAIPVNLDPAHTTARLEELVLKAKAALVAQGHDPAAAQPISIDITAEEEEK